MIAFWIILTGALVASSCALLGCFLVLRKMAMIGDAIAHAVLPGIVFAYFLSGSLNSLAVVVGASLVGLLATFLIETIHKKGNLQADAAIGLVFTLLFSIGVILISLYAGNVHIDADCVLHGEIALVPFDTWTVGNEVNIGPKAVWLNGMVLCLVSALIYFAYQPLKLTTFDPAYASAIGVSIAFWHYLMMGAVSLATVVAFESVGAILVVAFLIVPAATAYLLTDQLNRMLILSVIIGIISAVLGYYLATIIDGSIAGAMTTILGIEFLLAFIFSPNYGLIAKRLRRQGQYSDNPS